VLDADGRWREAAPGEVPGRYRARTKIRDHDGPLREVARFDTGTGRRRPSAAAAERALKEALQQRAEPRTGDAMTRSMSIAQAGAVWLQAVGRTDSGLSANTRDQYRAAWKRYVEPDPFAQFSLAEANRVPPIRTFLRKIADTRGTGAAKTTRTVISLIIGQAVDEGLFDVNAARNVPAPRREGPAPVSSSRRSERLRREGVTDGEMMRDTDRAFTPAERAHLVGFVLHVDDGARDSDVADLMAFLAATGARISEALSLRWDDLDFAPAKGRPAAAHLRGTKTEHSDRIVHLPGWAAEALRRRMAVRTSSPLVFPSPRSDAPRDRRNATRAIRGVLDRAGYPWASPHTFRRTVATVLDAQGVPIAVVADVLGHADPSTTARVCLGRKNDTSSVAAFL
jgi:integrase